MNRICSFLAVLVMLICGAAFAGEPSKAATKPEGKADNKPAINKICAVEGGDHTVDPEFYTIYNGMKIGFCCEDCIKSFKEDPDKYIAELKKRKDGIK